MRSSILGFNQSKSIDAGLTIDDLLLLQYIMYANSEPTMKHIVEDEKAYVWLNHKKIQEDLPILNISDGTLRNKLLNLKNKGFIISKMIASGPEKGSKTYYTITEKTFELINDNNVVYSDIKESTTNVNTMVSLQNDTINKQNSVPRHLEMTPNNILNNNKTISYNKLYDTTDSSVDELDEFLTKPKAKTYNASKDKSLDNKTKRLIDPENTAKYSNLVDFINNLSYTEKTREELFKWYNTIGKGKITIKALKDRLEKLTRETKTEYEMQIAINNSYINGYLGFFPPCQRKNTYVNNTEENPIQRMTEEMYARNADGSKLEY